MNNNVINQTKDKKYTKAELITIDSIRRVKNPFRMENLFLSELINYGKHRKKSRHNLQRYTLPYHKRGRQSGRYSNR